MSHERKEEKSNTLLSRVHMRFLALFFGWRARVMIAQFGEENSKHKGNDEQHLARTITWIARAQDAMADGGVSRGNSIIPSLKSDERGWQPSYPETTGYIIPTMLICAQTIGDKTLIDRAKRMGEWELSIQLQGGGVHGGNIKKPSAPAVFDTGQVLRGYLALYRETKDERYKEAATRAITWIASMEHDTEGKKSGRWITGNPSSVDTHMTTYMVYAIAPISEWGVELDNEEWKAIARRAGTATLNMQKENGWFDECDFWDKERPLLHTIGYTIDGLWDIGIALDEEEFILGAKRALDTVLRVMDAHGYIPGRLDSDWKGKVDSACLTGIAQIGVTAMKAYKKFGDKSYKQKAALAKEYLKSCQNNFDEKFGGGVGGVWGSWPIDGDYQPYQTLNWAAKYFTDLLIFFVKK